jgi:hypothetical protein
MRDLDERRGRPNRGGVRLDAGWRRAAQQCSDSSGGAQLVKKLTAVLTGTFRFGSGGECSEKMRWLWAVATSGGCTRKPGNSALVARHATATYPLLVPRCHVLAFARNKFRVIS